MLRSHPDPVLLEETIADAHSLARRLRARPKCSVTRSKFNKLFREGGIEKMLRIYVSIALCGKIDGGLPELQRVAVVGSWWGVRGRLLKACKAHGAAPRWEHVVEVKTCINECIHESERKHESFRRWFIEQVKNRWYVCLVTIGEDARLGKRAADRIWDAYDDSGIERCSDLVRDHLLSNAP